MKRWRLLQRWFLLRPTRQAGPTGADPQGDKRQHADTPRTKRFYIDSSRKRRRSKWGQRSWLIYKKQVSRLWQRAGVNGRHRQTVFAKRQIYSSTLKTFYNFTLFPKKKPQKKTKQEKDSLICYTESNKERKATTARAKEHVWLAGFSRTNPGSEASGQFGVKMSGTRFRCWDGMSAFVFFVLKSVRPPRGTARELSNAGAGGERFVFTRWNLFPSRQCHNTAL